MAGVGGNHGESQDFTQPWKFSDVVLVVEGQKLHVHRAVLAVCSPVFEKMFTSEFQGNGEKEIPIPGKMASEIIELLQVIYPSVEEKLTEENCHRLVRLANEYHMAAIVHRCENFIVEMMDKSKKDVLVELEFAQTHNLKKLKQECINRARYFSLEELKNHNVYDQIHFENVKDIMEGIIIRLRNERSIYSHRSPPPLTTIKAVGSYHGQWYNFDKPWKFSDVVLVVDYRELHVHRAVLAVYSPVFEEMFTSKLQGNGEKGHVDRAVQRFPCRVFEEKLTSQFQGNGKKENSIKIPYDIRESEMKELLQIIYTYPSVEVKLKEENYHRLLELAHRYQMKVIVQRCENFIVTLMNRNRSKKKFIEELVFAQKYNLQNLKHESIKQAQQLTLEELKTGGAYREIHEENLKEIMEGMILLLQGPRSSF